MSVCLETAPSKYVYQKHSLRALLKTPRVFILGRFHFLKSPLGFHFWKHPQVSVLHLKPP